MNRNHELISAALVTTSTNLESRIVGWRRGLKVVNPARFTIRAWVVAPSGGRGGAEPGQSQLAFHVASH